MSGGSDSSTSGPPEWAVPYFQNFLNKGVEVSGLPYQPYTGQRVAELNPYQLGGLNATANRALQGSPVNNAASGELTKTLSGGYLGSNPHLDSMVNRAQGDVMRGFAPIEARSGSFGNSGIQESMGRTLGDVSSQIRGADYANERNRMVGAIGMAPQIANQDYVDANALSMAGDAFQRNKQANLDSQYGNWTEAQNYPYKQLQTLGSTLGLGYGNQTTGPAPNRGAGMMGGAASGAALGSSFGPYGTALGALGGAVAGGK
jgi:hypothetical protein